MTTFFMFGKYSKEAVKGITAKRTAKAEQLIAGFGGKLRSVYALLGEYDMVIIADLPGTEEVFHASIEIAKETGIAFTTSPAIAMADFDTLFD
jgi:uncharacterized protein with GYD domain